MAALPILEDACILFKTLGGVNAFPICLDTQNIEQMIATGIAIWPTFGGFCLNNIASPHCFTVADHLARAVNIPVLHAEQHAAAATILGALSNALKLVGKAKEAVRVVINGSGPGGIGTAHLLLQAGFQHILVCDRLGILERYRLHHMNWAKLDIAHSRSSPGRGSCCRGNGAPPYCSPDHERAGVARHLPGRTGYARPGHHPGNAARSCLWYC